MPTQQSRAVLLCLDGVVHHSDLPVQAFARHITEQLSTEHVRPVIAGMRGFLENRAELISPDIDLSSAEDGYQAVEILARAAGLDDTAIDIARRASRTDLAASAWAVDPAAGLDALLAAIDGSAMLLLLTEPGDQAARPVLASIDVTVEEIVDAQAAPAIAQILGRFTAPDRLLVIGTRWSDQLEPAYIAGCATALIDHYGRGHGTPAFRSPDLAGLLGDLRGWLINESPETTTRTAR